MKQYIEKPLNFEYAERMTDTSRPPRAWALPSTLKGRRGRKGKFNPDSAYINKAVALYQAEGGEITKLESKWK